MKSNEFDILVVGGGHAGIEAALAADPVVTSSRRWRKMGILRTTLINTAIALGCLAGVDPARLAPLYRLSPGKREP